MWADKNGRHVLGLIEDYNALRKQISEGQQVLGEMEISLREVTGTKLQEPGIKDEGMKAEIMRLRKKLTEQEKKLHSTVKRLHCTNQLKENMEKVIIDQYPRCDASEEFRKDQNNPVDLHELLTEIQSLRVQLERSIETNKTLHAKLEEQLSKEKEEEMGSVSAVNINCLFKQESQHYAGRNGTHSASKDDFDCCSTSSSGTSCTPRLVPGHRMWADKNGRHVLGLIEDYNALRKQISEGQQVLGEMEISLREVTGTKLQEPGIKSEQCGVLIQAKAARSIAAVCSSHPSDPHPAELAEPHTPSSSLTLLPNTERLPSSLRIQHKLQDGEETKKQQQQQQNHHH
ncbi:UNVERIFIED_CONTAM: hypothetical protein H355_005627 [Colinus virginianus]|nr:hypothetical protein H355_005627 [Colinus virginianus]